jgi:hypothetical protein
VTTFIDSSRTTAGEQLDTPAFVYESAQPVPVMQCLRCAATGTKMAVAGAAGADLTATRSPEFSELNENSEFSRIRTPFNIVPPTAAGTATAGQTLRAEDGNWINDPANFKHQWIRCKPVTIPSDPATRCARIMGADKSAYTVTTSDIGFYIRVKVSAVNRFGAGAVTSQARFVAD